MRYSSWKRLKIRKSRKQPQTNSLQSSQLKYGKTQINVLFSSHTVIKHYKTLHFMFMVPCIVIYIIISQQDAAVRSQFFLLQGHSTCFGCFPHPSSGVHKTVSTAYGTGHFIVEATFFQRARWKKIAATIIWPVPEAVVKVLCTPDDGCGKHPKHVEWPCSEIKLTANSCILLAYYNITYIIKLLGLATKNSPHPKFWLK